MQTNSQLKSNMNLNQKDTKNKEEDPKDKYEFKENSNYAAINIIFSNEIRQNKKDEGQRNPHAEEGVEKKNSDNLDKPQQSEQNNQQTPVRKI